jgi:CheY-like chemotaxis protein
MRRAFEKSESNFKLVRVRNGKEAVEYLHGDGPYQDRAQYPFPDILMLDLKMPMMDGFDVLASLRNEPLAKELPVIVLTGSDQGRDVQRAWQMGASDCQVKPLESDALATLVQRVETRWLRHLPPT